VKLGRGLRLIDDNRIGTSVGQHAIRDSSIAHSSCSLDCLRVLRGTARIFTSGLGWVLCNHKTKSSSTKLWRLGGRQNETF
jgi:hypothetical protein